MHATSRPDTGATRRNRTLDVPDEHRDLVTHQRATLDYGIASHRLMLDWFRDHIDRHEQPEQVEPC